MLKEKQLVRTQLALRYNGRIIPTNDWNKLKLLVEAQYTQKVIPIAKRGALSGADAVLSKLSEKQTEWIPQRNGYADKYDLAYFCAAVLETTESQISPDTRISACNIVIELPPDPMISKLAIFLQEAGILTVPAEDNASSNAVIIKPRCVRTLKNIVARVLERI